MKKSQFNEFIDFLWENRKKYNTNDEFDYPDYGGIPESLYKNFSPEAVDAVQNIWFEFIKNYYSKKKQLAEAYRMSLMELGESIEADPQYAVLIQEIGTGRQVFGIFEKDKVQNFIVKSIKEEFYNEPFFEDEDYSEEVEKIKSLNIGSNTSLSGNDYIIEIKEVKPNRLVFNLT